MDSGKPPEPTGPSWKGILALLFSGVVLVPGLCMGMAGRNELVSIDFLLGLAALSVLLVFLAVILILFKVSNK